MISLYLWYALENAEQTCIPSFVTDVQLMTICVLAQDLGSSMLSL